MKAATIADARQNKPRALRFESGLQIVRSPLPDELPNTLHALQKFRQPRLGLCALLS